MFDMTGHAINVRGPKRPPEKTGGTIYDENLHPKTCTVVEGEDMGSVILLELDEDGEILERGEFLSDEVAERYHKAALLILEAMEIEYVVGS